MLMLDSDSDIESQDLTFVELFCILAVVLVIVVLFLITLWGIV